MVRHLSDRVAVMYLGRIVELAPTAALFAGPRHPYTRRCSTRSRRPTRAARQPRTLLRGDVPSPVRPPPGCHFHPRCPAATARCRVDDPALRELSPGHAAACHYAEEIAS